jgi:SAM-dependent methyltransferase
MPTAPTYLHQLSLQVAAAFTALFLAAPYFAIRGETLPWWAITLAVGGVALIFASLTRQPWWWRVIHALFAPLAWLVSLLEIAPGWFFLAFLAGLLVFRGALEGRIPLYLSNKASTTALVRLIRHDSRIHFLDIGAGLGTVVSSLARALPEARVVGIENAPLTWLIGRLRTARKPNCEWLWGDLWRADLSRFDVVYAFLSPQPMAELWEKAVREMRPGSTLISNTFQVPERMADRIVEVDDARRTLLYCYQIPDIKGEFHCEPPRPSPESDLSRRVP